MIRTLTFYIAKDLVKVTVLAGLMLTLLFTTIAIIEPLREKGLSSTQALQFFGYTMPVMVSLMLPIAALFAATIVYGRFAQDNELMASSASGISTWALMRPALWLAVIVSLVTLVLGFYVAPRMLYASQPAINNNLKNIFYHKLASEGHMRQDRYIVYADRVDMNGDWVEVTGLVMIDTTKPEDPLCMVASNARVDFPARCDVETGRTERYFLFEPNGATVFRQDGAAAGDAERAQMERGQLPGSVEDEPRFFDWDQLCQTWANPQRNPSIVQEMVKIRRQVCLQKIYADIVSTVASQHRYDKLSETLAGNVPQFDESLVIEAHEAKLQDHDRGILLTPQIVTTQPAAGAGDDKHTIVARIYERNKGLKQEIRASSARITGAWDEGRDCPVLSVTLLDAFVRSPGSRLDAFRHPKYDLLAFKAPCDIRQEMEGMTLDDLYNARQKPSQYSASVVDLLDKLDRNVVKRLKSRVLAEMHQRPAYAVDCFLMVMIGAALGLLLRGGQVLAAFAISAIPAFVALMMLFMGRQLIGNAYSVSSRKAFVMDPQLWGAISIWGGAAALAIAMGYLYLVRLRR